MSRLPAISVFLAGLLLSACTVPGVPPPRWLVLCVLSYDNDLEIHASTVLERLAEGVRGTDHVVSVLADFRGPGGLREYEIDRRGARYATLETDDSASGEVLGRFLRSRLQSHPGRRLAIVSSRTINTEAEERLPTCSRLCQVSSSAVGGRSRLSAIASSTLGPPGCATQDEISSIDRL